MFALDISQVREILDVSTITRIPNAPDYMCGVINVRGKVLPVVDLRRRFDMQPCECTIDTRIVVMDIYFEGNVVAIGALADAVSNVVLLDSDRIEPPPKIGARWETEFITGLGEYMEQFVVILNMDHLFTNEESQTVAGEISAQSLTQPSIA